MSIERLARDHAQHLIDVATLRDNRRIRLHDAIDTYLDNRIEGVDHGHGEIDIQGLNIIIREIIELKFDDPSVVRWATANRRENDLVFQLVPHSPTAEDEATAMGLARYIERLQRVGKRLATSGAECINRAEIHQDQLRSMLADQQYVMTEVKFLNNTLNRFQTFGEKIPETFWVDVKRLFSENPDDIGVQGLSERISTVFHKDISFIIAACELLMAQPSTVSMRTVTTLLERGIERYDGAEIQKLAHQRDDIARKVRAAIKAKEPIVYEGMTLTPQEKLIHDFVAHMVSFAQHNVQNDKFVKEEGGRTFELEYISVLEAVDGGYWAIRGTGWNTNLCFRKDWSYDDVIGDLSSFERDMVLTKMAWA